jgi:hypothetical protein
MPVTVEDFEVDMSGDIFGDYEDYGSEEFGLAPFEDEEIHTHNEDSDEDEGVDGYETFLEPNRPLPNPNVTLSESDFDDVDNSNGIIQRASRLRGGAEAELKNKPYVVKFSKGKAGPWQCIRTMTASMGTQHTSLKSTTQRICSARFLQRSIGRLRTGQRLEAQVPLHLRS